jgi:hypothetical protein
MGNYLDGLELENNGILYKNLRDFFFGKIGIEKLSKNNGKSNEFK